MTEMQAMNELTENRSLAAVPFGGRYRLIDFILSNLVNSGIESVGIFTKDRFRSLMDHLGSGRDWDLSRKRKGLFFCPPTRKQEYYNGFFDYLNNHLDYFNRSEQKYVIVAASNVICNLDFERVLRQHIAMKADITEVCYKGTPLNIFIIEKSLLLDCIKSHRYESIKNMQEFVILYERRLNIHSYEHDGYTAIIDSVQSYYKHSMSLLHPEMWKSLFVGSNPIFTKVKDEPPTRYQKGAIVTNSQVANGCQIEGTVENSIIFRAVHIGKGAVVRNSIIMQKSIIEDGAIVDGVIIDKDVRIEASARIQGQIGNPFVIPKGEVQGELMR
ncbi:glucose-1-phosphate adenylyltransferase [Bacillus solimangrovi]|uniref:Glucose-1-phosphate adenylyltransferase n=2 Tax=Bacillus solimangrovi TaxID=1305675 RepID=A0A1E5LGF1_9BACI|nr:glucose-1-phosphate adenylyltransferase [Bacillus solimangrovi]